MSFVYAIAEHCRQSFQWKLIRDTWKHPSQPIQFFSICILKGGEGQLFNGNLIANYSNSHAIVIIIRYPPHYSPMHV